MICLQSLKKQTSWQDLFKVMENFCFFLNKSMNSQPLAFITRIADLTANQMEEYICCQNPYFWKPVRFFFLSSLIHFLLRISHILYQKYMNNVTKSLKTFFLPFNQAKSFFFLTRSVCIYMATKNMKLPAVEYITIESSDEQANLRE